MTTPVDDATAAGPPARPGPKTVLITGAAGGLGRAFALAFAARGDRVAVADLDDAGAAETAVLAEATGASDTWSGRVDVSSVHETEQVLEQVGAFGGGRIDVLVNNAAVYATLNRSPLEAIDPDEFDLVLRVNVKGTWLMVRAASPYLGPGSSIVNVASATVFSGSEQWLHYVSSKGAIIAMSRVMARELGRREIRVNTLAPGFVLTEASFGQLGNAAASYGVDRGALRRSSTPEDIVGACLFLAGEEAGFITGQTLIVDGGRQFL